MPVESWFAICYFGVLGVFGLLANLVVIVVFMGTLRRVRSFGLNSRAIFYLENESLFWLHFEHGRGGHLHASSPGMCFVIYSEVRAFRIFAGLG